MEVTAIETIRLPGRPNLLLAQVHTDSGLVGLGETSRGALATQVSISCMKRHSRAWSHSSDHSASDQRCPTSAAISRR